MKEEHLYTSNSKKLPLAALIAIGIVICVELFIGFNADHFSGAFNSIVRRRKKLLEAPSFRHDVVIFGDSRSYSMNPKFLEKEMGNNLSVGNYCWPFTGVETYEFMLDACIKNNKKPKLIIAGFLPDYFAIQEKHLSYKQIKIYRIRLYDVFPSLFIVKKAWKEHSWILFWDLIAYRITPLSSRYRDKLPSVMFHLLTLQGWLQPDEDEYRILQGQKNSGSFRLFDDETAPPDVMETYAKIYHPLSLYKNEDVLKKFEDFLKKAEHNNIRILLFNPPILRQQYTRFNELGVIQAYNSRIENWARDYDNFHYIEPLLSPYPRAMFADSGHLNLAGDKMYREYYIPTLSQKIQQILSH